MVYDLGKIIPRIKGNYISLETYDVLDVVYYNGSSYICKQANTRGKLPTNTTYWQIFALKGEMTTQLTPEQIAEIVQDVMAQGVVVDTDYSAFKASTEAAIQTMPSPGNGILTIKRNNATVGTFSANQSEDANINITVPTQLSQMADYIQFVASILMKGSVHERVVEETTFEKVEPGCLYTFEEPIGSLTIEDLVPLVEVGNLLPARIIFTAAENFNPVLPACWVHCCEGLEEGEVVCHSGEHYMFEVYGDHIIVRQYTYLIPSN